MNRRACPGDLTDAQWAVLGPLIPPARPGGRPRSADVREVVNGLLYVNRGGCSWRALPHDPPPWRTCYNYFRWWQDDGTWDAVLAALRPRARERAGRAATPSAGCIDGQSVKTAGGGAEVGTDGGERVRGRKRHVATDTLGLLPAAVVTAANADDGAAAPRVLGELPPRAFPRLRVPWGDRKYRNDSLDAYPAGRGCGRKCGSGRRAWRGSRRCGSGGSWSRRSAARCGRGGWPATTSGRRSAARPW